MPLTPGAQVGEYRLVQPLGQGGMACSWLARGPAGEDVVLKFPDPTQLGDPVAFERFRREMAIGQRLHHPAIPKALAIREDGRPPYLVMEYVQGELLSDVLRRRGRLPWDEAVALLRQLLDALAYIHAQGVCHRDLKPENLLVTPDGRLQIIDFGIALLDGRPRVTWRGFSGLAGTPQYMAPEQIRGERGGPQSDVYAAGAILYEMLTGRPPFTGDNPLAVMHQALHADPVPVSRLVPVPPGADAVLARALCRDKAQRFPSAEAFAAALAAPEAVSPPRAAPAVGPRPGAPWWAEPLPWLGLLALATAAATVAAVWYVQHARGP
jgi:serine/threonine protein kinase